MYDFLVPLYGSEHFSLVKETSQDPGSVSLPKVKNNTIKTEAETLSNLKQEGFGNLETKKKVENDTNETVENENDAIKIQKLGSIYDAMKKAKVETSELKFRPKKKKMYWF